MIFDTLYEKFSVDTIARTIFLESLEVCILNERLDYVMPAVMQQLVIHYTQRGWLERIEACIVRIDITSLDIHQVRILCY